MPWKSVWKQFPWEVPSYKHAAREVTDWLGSEAARPLASDSLTRPLMQTSKVCVFQSVSFPFQMRQIWKTKLLPYWTMLYVFTNLYEKERKRRWEVQHTMISINLLSPLHSEISRVCAGITLWHNAQNNIKSSAFALQRLFQICSPYPAVCHWQGHRKLTSVLSGVAWGSWSAQLEIQKIYLDHEDKVVHLQNDWLWATLMPSAAPQDSVAWLCLLNLLKSTVKVLWFLLCQRTLLTQVGGEQLYGLHFWN